MKLGKVIGKVWATQKDPQLKGIKMYVMQPINEEYEPMGAPIIAADGVGSGEGEIVFWVSSREATLGIPGRIIPSDATIVGILDSSYTAPREEIENAKKSWKR
ncbi:EutN/CcmL family microcompartment protein [candidate division KSB1 bacterium]|nr:EutN/CcmL family microcompartment protein [candidate division KSB1 bacterium]